MNTALDTLVALGVVGKRRGLAGEVRVKCWNPASDALEAARAVVLRDAAGGERRMRVLSFSWTEPGHAVMRLEGIASAEAADAVRGHAVLVERATLPALEEGEYYHVDLVGLAAVDASGAELGKVTAVIDYPSVDCLLVEASDGLREVPMVAPYFVRVEMGARRVVVAEWSDLDLVAPPRARRGADSDPVPGGDPPSGKPEAP